VKLIILDRDGVINVDSDTYIKSVDEWVPIDGSIEAIAQLHRAGWRIVVATNQSGLARGLFDITTLHAMHKKCCDLLAPLGGMIDAFFVCPHSPSDDCDCRKPSSGLFREIARRFDLSLEGVPAVGDSLRDLQAASQMGCTPWLVETGKGLKTRGMTDLPDATRHGRNLADVAAQLLQEDQA
jgi:D-glycero-D-manno-heptose 1,7-bisphosphate phosphatase